jgi:PIN domain nuclease of toxin-antitoxin system
MRLLVDTHCWLWMLVAPEKFSEATRRLLDDPDNELLLSAASAWEIAIKFALGKLALPIAPAEYVPSRMKSSGTTGLSVEHVHALHVASLPNLHADPFDRLLIAQAQIEKLPVLTADAQFRGYEVVVIAP